MSTLRVTPNRAISRAVTRALDRIASGCRLGGATLFAFAAMACSAPAFLAAENQKAVIVSINDVYQIEGINGGRSGGLARVRALRAKLEKSAPDLLFLHAGDFLSPSFVGGIFKGAQMIDVMNLLDGNAARGAIDERMFVAFGNHEFDSTNCNKDGPLPELVAASEFTWLASNFDFGNCAPLRPLVGDPKIAVNRIVESGGLKVGLFGVTLSLPRYAKAVRDPLEVACQQVRELRTRGADVVVALTHLPLPLDRELLGMGTDWTPRAPEQRNCADAPDVVIGGHDHHSMSLPSTGPKLFKADADAKSAWLVEITKEGSSLKIDARLEWLGTDKAQDPLVKRISDFWLRMHDERFCLRDCLGVPAQQVKTCLKAVDGGACLNEPYVRAASDVQTEEIHNRSYETGFGDFLADTVREAGDADVGFLNAGSIRINQNLPAGTVITRRHLEQMFPFRNKLVIREVSGGDLWRAIEHAVAKRGEGPWAHFSGLAVKLSEAGAASNVARIIARRRDGTKVEITPQTADLFKVASSAFVLGNGDGHGFNVCAGASVSECIGRLEADPQWPSQGDAADVAGLVREKLRTIDPQRGLELPIDRRLCDRGDKDCLIDRS